ncbi:MAG: ion channel [Nocardioides sp.]|nr:ion channel [Nocardioides sp.]
MRSRLRLLKEHPSALLLAAQLLQVLTWPFLLDSIAGRAILGVLGMVAVGAAVFAVRRTPALGQVVLFLGAPAMVFTLLEALRPSTDWIVLTSAALHAPFYLYVSYAMLRYLFHDEKVTHDELFATGAAFTVVAWAFAYVYAALQVIWPGSFVSPLSEDQQWFELLFLSFTTLTGTGLSDILPTLPHARSVVVVEEVTGVFYVALVVARMVGLTMRRPAR